jgi:hypothetical protein
MNEQKALQAKYEELIEKRSAMKGMVNKTKYKEVQENIQEISRALKESTNNLVRSLKDNPNVSGNLIKVQRDRMELHDLLVRCMQELRDRGTYYTIVSKVEEVKNQKIKLQQLRAREKELRDAVSKLERTLTDEETMYAKTVSDQKTAIALLKEELQTIKGSTSVDAKFKRRESLAHVSSIWRECKLKERILEDRVKELEDRIHTENVVHTETKEFLIRKHLNLSNNVTEWEAKYDADVGEMDQHIREMTTKRNQLLEKLYVLQTRKQQEVEEELKRQQESERETKAKKSREIEDKRRNRAARTLQRSVRAFVKRCKELEALGGGKKKKGAGGKKGKGKKK